MKDQYGRKIEYLRISVTDFCNLKCIYCNPDGKYLNDNPSKYLKPEEFEKIVRSMAKEGIRKIRITGGEPLVRPDVCEIIERIAGIPGIEDISMTTNGINLDRMAGDLKKAGLKRLNISLDTLKEDKFRYITGGGDIARTMNGIKKALELGMTPVKINTVLVRGVNDDEIDDLIALTKDEPIQVRFIELMPIGFFGEANAEKIIYSDEIIGARPHLKFQERSDKGAPATYYTIDGHQGKVGFISAMSHKFCSDCNRIRLTSDGKIRPCLGNNGEIDIRGFLNLEPEMLDQKIREIIYRKPRGHNFTEGFTSSRKMNGIGG